LSRNSYIIKIGTRGSALALAQAYYIRDALKNVSDLQDDNFEIIPIQTSGDTLLSTKLQDFGGKGLFTKEIEQALLDKTIDIAVHSAKDVPTKRQDGLQIIATPPREDYRDTYISYKYPLLSDLPLGATLGTASLRRTAQFLHKRPDLNITLLRGNVQTRLQKLQNGICDATILALAGLNRLNMSHIATHILETPEFLPAPAQGAIMIETRLDISVHLLSLLNQINCPDTFDCITAERAFLKALDGNCRMPIAALAEVDNQNITLMGTLLSEDGLVKVHKTTMNLRKNAYDMGFELGKIVKQEFNQCKNT
jgi:hydroxymethylbilane synthase